MEFKTFSFFNILQASINIVIVLILFILDRLSYLSNLSYKIYIPLYLLTYLIVLIGYVDKLKQYVFGKVKAIFKIRYDILGLIKLGLPVTISYQVATLIFNIDNQFISMFFSTITFGLYSFAYSMVSLVTTILNTTSTVLFPTLNGRTMNKNIAIYNKLIMLLLILVYLMVIVYYPVELIVKNFLPEYVNSLIYFKIVIPGVGISSSISLIIFNFFKALKKGHIYFIYGCFILVFAVVVNTAVYFITHSAISIAIASLIILFTWYLITNRYLATKYGIIYKKNTFYLVIMTLVFEVYVIGIRSIFISILFYFISYCIITLLFYRKELLRICKRVF
ncbi:integral membrane protein [Limosilactobacillus vaginalis DSM 5837 = ATCC 49540]|nr:integral membrane protein [Limosilactobacillus vaginalis DSM 5837 = ATCC 49540]